MAIRRITHPKSTLAIAMPPRAPSHAHFACLECRKGFKRPRPERAGTEETVRIPCPDCGKRMQYMGYAFQAPRKNAVKRWRLVAALIQEGFRFERYAGPLPVRLTDLAAIAARGEAHPAMTRERHAQAEKELRGRRIGSAKAAGRAAARRCFECGAPMPRGSLHCTVCRKRR